MKRKLFLFIICFVMMFFIMNINVYGKEVMYMECDNVHIEEFANGLYNVTMNFKVLNLDGTPLFAFKVGDVLYVNTQSKDRCWKKDVSKLKNACSKDDSDNVLKGKDFKCFTNVRYKAFEKFNITEGDGVNLFSYNTFVLGGEEIANNVHHIEKSHYVFYKINVPGESDPIIIGEGFDKNGNFAYINHDVFSKYVSDYSFGADFRKFFGFEYPKEKFVAYDMYYLAVLADYFGANYFKLDEYFETRNVSVLGYCSSWDDCRDNKGYEPLFSSNNQVNLRKSVDKWYEDVGVNFDKLNKYLDFVDNKDLDNIYTKMTSMVKNGSAYQFDSSYTASQLLSDLEEIYDMITLVEEEKNSNELIDYFSGEKTDVMTSAQTYVFNDLLGKARLSELIKSHGQKRNVDQLRQMVADDISLLIQDKLVSGSDGKNIYDYIKNNEQFEKDIEKFMSLTSYFNYMKSHTDLTSDEMQRLSDLNDKMIEFARKYNISPNVFSCENLIGDALRDKIMGYFNVVRIAIPILLIGLGIMDFAKAIFGGDDDSMKKAQKTFLKRIGIAVLFFCTPIFVNLILNLANRVWLFINPNMCIKF